MVKFGIVGFGLHAVKRLMPGFTLSKNCRVTALSRRDAQKAKASAEEYKIPRAYTSVYELCQSKDVDAVLVTTPNASHLDDVLTAVAHGKHVLCEKPMGLNADECHQMVDAARKANVILGVAHVFRFHESILRMKERIAAGQIGTPVFARADFSFVAGEHPRTWLTDRSIAGGGPAADVGVHCIDTLRFILQDQVVKVTALAQQDEKSGDVESAASVALQFSRGTLATVSVPIAPPITLPWPSMVLKASSTLTMHSQ
jgi:predicted dehydrogenase